MKRKTSGARSRFPDQKKRQSSVSDPSFRRGPGLLPGARISCPVSGKCPFLVTLVAIAPDYLRGSDWNHKRPLALPLLFEPNSEANHQRGAPSEWLENRGRKQEVVGGFKCSVQTNALYKSFRS